MLQQGYSKRALRELSAAGRVWLDQTPIRDLARPAGDATPRVDRGRPRHRPDVDPAVVHRDPHLVVVYKPSGVLSVPAPGRREASVEDCVRRWFGAAFPVHRIDEGTSGLLLFALDEHTQLALKALFQAHDLRRDYLALVRGRPTWEERRMDTVLVRDRGDGLRGSAPGSTAEGKRAVTHLRRVDTYHDVSLVEARLETGRTHQVRIHLAEAGHPILGDTLYGRSSFSRLALHAAWLAFRHPVRGVELSLRSPLPDELWRRLHARF